MFAFIFFWLLWEYDGNTSIFATSTLFAVIFSEHKLFIGMLPKNVSEAEVSALFSNYGNVKDLQILRGSQQTSKGTYLSFNIVLFIFG